MDAAEKKVYNITIGYAKEAGFYKAIVHTILLNALDRGAYYSISTEDYENIEAQIQRFQAKNIGVDLANGPDKTAYVCPVCHNEIRGNDKVCCGVWHE